MPKKAPKLTCMGDFNQVLFARIIQ